MRNGMGMGMGAGGGKASFTNPAIPAIDNIVRAWSLRRLIPAYKEGSAIQAERADEGAAGVPDDGADTEVVAFEKDGRITMPSGNDAYASVLFEQSGNNGTVASPKSELRQTTFDLCPKVLESNAILPGLKGVLDFMPMAASYTDTVLATTFGSNAYTFSIWINTSSTEVGTHPFMTWGISGTGIAIVNYIGTSKKIEVYSRSLTTLLTTGTYGDGKWYNVVSTMDVVGNVFKVYIFNRDGSLLETVTGTAGSVATGYTYKLALLGRADGSASFRVRDGYANDLVIWNVALSADDAAAYNEATRGYYLATGAK